VECLHVAERAARGPAVVRDDLLVPAGSFPWSSGSFAGGATGQESCLWCSTSTGMRKVSTPDSCSGFAVAEANRLLSSMGAGTMPSGAASPLR
jgi:hypothetical protein